MHYIETHWEGEMASLYKWKVEQEKGDSWQVWDILAFLLISKIYSADFCRTQVRVHCITAASQRLLTGENGIIFLRVVLIGGGGGVCVTNLLQKLFTLFHLLHWENERELINCHLSEFSTNYCLQLPPHQPLCSKIERKILGFWYSCLLWVTMHLLFLLWGHLGSHITFLVFEKRYYIFQDT